jgi:hypothetical protein
MSDSKHARLVERGRNKRNGGTYEIWDVGNGCWIYVDFNPCPTDTGIPETMAFPMDLRDNAVTSWSELGVWYEDATGGKAIRELGYESVEDGDGDGI